MIRLYITPDGQQPYLLSFERAQVSVGSAAENDVQLKTQGVSSKHFRLRQSGAEVVLEDAGSRNGTYVNDRKVVGTQVLAADDVIRIVGFRIKLLLPGAAPRPEPPRPPLRPSSPVIVAPSAAGPRAQPAPPRAPVAAPVAPPIAAPTAAPIATPITAPTRPAVATPAAPEAAAPAVEVDPPPGFDAPRVAAIVGPRARAWQERADEVHLLRGDELRDAQVWVQCGQRVTPGAGAPERALVASSGQRARLDGRRRLGIVGACVLALISGGWTARQVLAGGPDAHATGLSRDLVARFLDERDAQQRRTCVDTSAQQAAAALAEARGAPDVALRGATEALRCVTEHEGLRGTPAEQAVRSLLAATHSQVVDRGPPARVVATDPRGQVFAWGRDDGTVVTWDAARARGVAREGAAAVRFLAVADRGDKLVALDAAAQVRVWNLLDADAAPRRLALERGGEVGEAAMSRDARVLVVAAATAAELRLFDVSGTGTTAGLALPGLPAATGALALSDDGSRVFAASGPGVLGWRVLGGRRADKPTQYIGHEAEVTALALATCPKDQAPHWLLSGDAAGAVRVWDLTARAGKAKPIALAGTDAVGALAMTADCRHVVAAGARSLRLWDLRSKEPDRTPRELQTGGPVTGLALDGGAAVVAAGTKLVVCDLASAAACRELTGHGQAVGGLDLAETSGWAITSSDDGTVRLWDTRASAGAASLQAHHPHPAEPIRALSLADEGRVLTASGADAYVWQLRGVQPPEQALQLVGQGGRPIKAAVLSPNAAWAATAADEPSLVLWRLGSERATPTVVPTGSRLTRLAFSEDGAWLVGIGPQAACAVALQGAGAPSCQPLPQTGELVALTFIPGTHRVALGGTDREVLVVDLDAMARGTGNSRQDLGKGTGVVRVLAASPDGRWLAAGGEHADGRLWDLKGAAPPTAQKLGGLVETVEALGFGPDGRWLVAGAGRKLFAWDLAAFAQPPTRVLEGLGGTVRALTFSPDGATLLSGGADGKLLAWSLTSDAAPLELGAHPNMVSQLAVLPTGDFVVSAGTEATLHFWPLSAASLWSLAQRVQGPASP